MAKKKKKKKHCQVKYMPNVEEESSIILWGLPSPKKPLLSSSLLLNRKAPIYMGWNIYK